jgi:glycosyltransferase involved in cell wall biosynthesis
MKISIIEPLGSNGGFFYYNCGFCDSLKKINPAIELYSTGENIDFSGVVFYNFFNLLQNKKLNIFTRSLGLLYGYFFTFLRIFLFRPNLVVIHIFHFDIIDLIRIAILRLYGCSTLCVIHDWDDLNYVFNSRNKRLLKGIFSSDKFILATHSDQVRMLASKYFNKNVFIYPHYDFTSNISAENGSISDFAYDFIFWGNVKKSKGVDLILESVNILSKSYNFKLLIAGRFHGNYLSEVLDYVRSNHLSDFIDVVDGYIPDTELSDYVARSRCVLLPYKMGYSSGVVLRAIDLNKDIIASDLPCFSKYITDGVNGLLFSTNDSHDLSIVMSRYLVESFSFDVNLLKCKIIAANDIALYPDLWNIISKLD